MACNTRGPQRPEPEVTEEPLTGWRATPREERANTVLALLALLLVLGVVMEVARRPVVVGDTADAGVTTPLAPVYLADAAADELAVVGRPMPKDLVAGQKRAPCNPRLEHEMNGGCWLELTMPPGNDQCGPDAVVFKGKCYVPVGAKPKPDVSFSK